MSSIRKNLKNYPESKNVIDARGRPYNPGRTQYAMEEPWKRRSHSASEAYTPPEDPAPVSTSGRKADRYDNPDQAVKKTYRKN